jgi:HAD superfamily hydrolase (TIGR01509 family)
MDGTIVDTEPLWMRAETDLVKSYGGTWSHEQALQLVGSGLYDSASILIAAGVQLTPIEIIRHLTDQVTVDLREQGLPWRPGARELLAALHDAGVPSALVTMSFRSMAELVADSVGFDAFDAVVAGDDVTHAKPHPEAYLRAAAQLGVPIERCVAIEDSVTGLGSAVASGAAAVAVPFLVEIPPSPAHERWETLTGRGLDDLSDVLRAHDCRLATAGGAG